MKKIKFSFLVFLISFLFCWPFGWVITFIIISSIAFAINEGTERVEGKKEKKERLIYYAGWLLSSFLGCLVFYLIMYLKGMALG